MITPAATFAAFAIAQSASHRTEFRVQNAFTSLALLAIMINPIAELVTATTNVASALSCLDRIQRFLQKQTLTDRHEPRLEGGELSVLHIHPAANGGDGALALSALDAPGAVSTPVFRARNASFGYETSHPVLGNITMEVLPSMVVMILGPVGSGKSTLLRSLMKETHLLAGNLESPSIKQIAYCDQVPWLLNQSVKDNIVAFSEYNEDRYNSVIKACQLEKDFNQLPDGDETITGSKAVSLSGGQRARIVSHPCGS